MVRTRTQQANAAVRRRAIIERLTGFEAESPVDLALNRAEMVSIMDVISSPYESFDEMPYMYNLRWDDDPPDPDAVPAWDQRNIVAFHSGILKCLKAYAQHHIALGQTLNDEWWDNATQASFDTYRISQECTARITLGNTVGNPMPRGDRAPLDEHQLNLRNWDRGIKRDPSVFPELKTDQGWPSWNRSFVSILFAQGVEAVLQNDYVPPEPEKPLFRKKQDYVYSVLNKVLRTDNGKASVRQYEKTRDAQQVYRLVKQHCEQSTKANIIRSDIMSYISNVRLGDGTWNGTMEAFVIHWCEQVRAYEKDAPKEELFSGQQKMVMLQNAVRPIDDLRKVHETARHLKAGDGTKTEWDQYVDLLKSAAQEYDARRGSTGIRAQARRRSVYQHAISDFAYDDPDDMIHNVDTPIQVFQLDRQPRPPPPFGRIDGADVRRPRLRFDQWKDLNQSAKDTWDKLSDQEKRIILRYVTPQKRPMGRKTQALAAQILDDIGDPDIADFIQVCAADFALLDLEADAAAGGDEQELDTPLQANAATSLEGKAMALPPGDPRLFLSDQSTPRSTQANSVRYMVSRHASQRHGALIDRGANGPVIGSDQRVFAELPGTISVEGIDRHQILTKVGHAGGVIITDRGPVIGITHHGAVHGKDKSILACTPMEMHGLQVDDRSSKNGGSQRIVTPEGYTIPLNVVDGLVYLPCRPYTDHEWDNLPHVFLNSPHAWDLRAFDYESVRADGTLVDTPTPGTHHVYARQHFDEFGDYINRHAVNQATLRSFSDGEISPPIHAFLVQEVDAPRLNRATPNFEPLRDKFLFASPDIIRRTFDATTQLARIPQGTHLRKWFRSPNPVLNIPRRHEPVATDTVFGHSEALCFHGSFAAQFYVGCRSLVVDVFPLPTEKAFRNTLDDIIRQRGAMEKLISDSAQTEKSREVKEILRAYCIQDWQSEAHMQHQNFAERRWQDVKRLANTVMDRQGVPRSAWLLVLKYVCFIMNRMAVRSLGWRTPLEKLTGHTPDISVLLRFTFWEPVYYRVDNPVFGRDSPELRGRMVGFSENVGHALTYLVLTDDTLKLIHRSALRSGANPNVATRNLALPPAGGESALRLGPTAREEARDNQDITAQDTIQQNIEATPEELQNLRDIVGRTILMKRENGTHIRALVKQRDDGRITLQHNGQDLEEIFTYQQIMDHLAREDEDDRVWQFKAIVGHTGPLKPGDSAYRGSSWNVRVEWENGERTDVPLALIAQDDPVSCALYARDEKLLDLPGWKRFRGIIKRQKKLLRMANQAKLRSFRTTPKYKYGIEVPRDFRHAMALDKAAGNSKWKDAITTETRQLFAYDTFQDIGKGTPVPEGYKLIRVHLVFDVKHDLRHKARMVAGGHLTDIPVDSVYSGVVSLRGVRLVVFIGELNGLKVWATDIGNAYLEAYTLEKVAIRAGPEFGDLEGHTLIIVKALYGLRSSGLRWHERFADCLRDQGFKPCRAEPDIWIQKNGDTYEYVAVYVDDLAFAMRDPESFVKILTDKYKFKLKGTGELSFHLGCDFYRDKNGVLCMSPKKYLERVADSYSRMFGQKPRRNVWSPLESGDHPELDDSDTLDPAGTEQYQSIIGTLQWAVSLGRFDIATAVMSLSSFRAIPRKGHLDRARRIVSYLLRFNEGAIRFRTGRPDFSMLPDTRDKWEYSVYGKDGERVPDDAPVALGQEVTLTHYVDANLYHDWVSGKSVSGILHFVNKTPIDWYTKKQATVETATFGSEYIAARLCVEQAYDLRTTLRYLGVRVVGKSRVFGDNESVVNSSMKMDGKLHKRHNALSYHKVREAIAHGWLVFHHIPGKSNPADILSKHWAHGDIWDTLRPLLFWEGDTLEIPHEDETGKDQDRRTDDAGPTPAADQE